MSDPILYQEKLLKPAVFMLERGVDQEDEALRMLSLRALGNMALGAPKKESEMLRFKAFVLFGTLAKVVRISKKHLFKVEVKKAWVSLMLHCQDPCSCTARACMETMFQCLHFWGPKGLESPPGQRAASTDEMMVFQTTVCSVLTQKKPAVLYSFLLETITYVRSSLSSIRVAACNLAGIIMKQMSASYLKKLDFPALRNSLQELQLDSDPGVRRAALETLKILDNCSQHGLRASPEGVS